VSRPGCLVCSIIRSRATCCAGDAFFPTYFVLDGLLRRGVDGLFAH